MKILNTGADVIKNGKGLYNILYNGETVALNLQYEVALELALDRTQLNALMPTMARNNVFYLRNAA
jgi:hypothetical protein